MKKELYVICAMLLSGVSAFQFTSCTNSEDENIPPRITELRFNINVNNASTHDTKVVKTSWEDGDKIYVFFKAGDTYLDAIKYVTLTYNGTTEEWDGALSGSLTDASELGSAGTMYGVFFPFGGVNITAGEDNSIAFLSSGNTNSVLNDLPIFTYYLTGDADYTIETAGDESTLNGTLNMEMPDDYVYFFIDKQGDDFYTDEKYRLSGEGIVPVACAGYKNGSFTELELLADQPLWGYKYGDGVNSGMAFSGKIDESWSSSANHRFILFSDGDPALSKTMTGVTLESHNSVKFSNPLDDSNEWSRAFAEPGTVDLGTSTCLWADRNLGASDMTDIGWRFGWGQIVTPNYFYYEDWYPEAMINSDLTGDYAIYDVARAYLGEGWRMPTVYEFERLYHAIDENSVVPTYDMDLDYVTLVYNENTLYLPITSYYKRDKEAGDEDTGYFWLSSYYTYEESSACYFYVDRYYGDTDYYYLSWFLGATVRPVKDIPVIP